MNKFRELSRACRDEKVFGRLVGIFFVLIGLGFVIVGVTVLPVFGFIIALPLIALGFYYFRKSPGEDEACKTDIS